MDLPYHDDDEVHRVSNHEVKSWKKEEVKKEEVKKEEVKKEEVDCKSSCPWMNNVFSIVGFHSL